MLAKIKRRIGIDELDEKSDLLIMDIIEQSQNLICLYLNIPAIEDVRLNSIIQSLSIDLYNRIGDEGKKTSIYSDYRSDFAEEILAPYMSVLNSIKAQMEEEKRAQETSIIRFI